MASIFSVFGEILIDNTNADKSIDSTTEKAEKSSSKVGSAFSSIAKGAAACRWHRSCCRCYGNRRRCLQNSDKHS
jgi:hypothetical protein